MPYLGNAPAEAYSNIAYQDFGTQSGTVFTLDFPAGSPGELEVFVNNVRQEPSVAYTVSGTTLTMTGTVAASDDFYVVFQGKAQQTVTHPANTGLVATTGTFSSTLAVTGKITSTAGITFGSDTAAANVLDDYEEGSYTFDVIYNPDAGGTVATGATKADAATAHYTKIGNQCTVYFASVDLSTLGLGTTPCLVDSYELPFAAASTAVSNTQVSGFQLAAAYNNVNFAAQLSGVISASATTLLFRAYATAYGGGSGFIEIPNGSVINGISITYQTA